MSFVSDLARKHGHDPIMTFDQSLYWKVMEIATRKQQKVSFSKMVVMLSTFHTCMSFYSSVGHIMVGSCTQSLLELIYAERTVTHILSGKVFAHATRAHIITASALSALLISNVDKIDFDLNVDDGNLLQNSMKL